MANDKWTMFKNYLHNELGITKDDIRCWVKEAVSEEARKLLDQTFGHYKVEEIMEQTLYKTIADRNWDRNTFKREVSRMTAEILVEKISLKIEV